MSSVDEDPDPWITTLELKRRRVKTFGTTIEDNDLVIHILNNLPKECKTVVELCEEDLSKRNFNLQSVKERIRARYSRLQKTNESDEAIVLMMKTQYKKACPLCGKIGHEGADYFTLKKKETEMRPLSINKIKFVTNPKTVITETRGTEIITINNKTIII